VVKSILRSIVFSLVFPWLGMAAFYTIIGMFLAAIGAHMFAADVFYGVVFVWIAAWAVFLLVCYAKSTALPPADGVGGAG
jgi:hypothetical protein